MPLATGKRGSSRASPRSSSSPCVLTGITGAAARDDLKVGEFDLERDSAAANAGALAVAPYLVDDLSKRVARDFVDGEIGGECVLGTD